MIFPFFQRWSLVPGGLALRQTSPAHSLLSPGQALDSAGGDVDGGWQS